MITRDLRSFLAPIPRIARPSYIYLTLGPVYFIYEEQQPTKAFISSSFSTLLLLHLDAHYVRRRPEIF